MKARPFTSIQKATHQTSSKPKTIKKDDFRKTEKKAGGFENVQLFESEFCLWQNTFKPHKRCRAGKWRLGRQQSSTVHTVRPTTLEEEAEADPPLTLLLFLPTHAMSVGCGRKANPCGHCAPSERHVTTAAPNRTERLNEWDKIKNGASGKNRFLWGEFEKI